MTHEELLQELRDIEMPAEPSWWLISPVWQLVLVVSAIAIAAALVYRYRRRQHARMRAAREQLTRIRQDYRVRADCRATLQSLSEWLKQVAMSAFPQQPVGALTGRAWLAFLQQSTSIEIFDSEMQQLFAEDVYRPEVDVDLNPAIEACERWLQAISETLMRQQENDRVAA